MSISIDVALRVIETAEWFGVFDRKRVERAEVVLFDARRYREMARASVLLDGVRT